MIHSRMQRKAFHFGTLLCLACSIYPQIEASEVPDNGDEDSTFASRLSAFSNKVLVADTIIDPGSAGSEAGNMDTSEILESILPYFSYPPVSNAGLSAQFRPVIMRGLSPDHTLVLVNGKRRHKAALLHINNIVGRGALGVDFNMIPAVAVERIEVSPEGASASFGSDAVAGVVNFQLKEDTGGSFAVHLGTHLTEVTDVPDLLEVGSTNGALLFDAAGDRNPDDGDGNVLSVAGDWGFRLGREGFVHFSAEFRDSEDTDRTGFDTRQQYALLGDGSFDIRELTFDRFSHQHGSAEIEDINFFVNAAYPVTSDVEVYFFGSHGKRKALNGLDYRRALDERNVTDLYPDGFLPRIESNVDDVSVTLGFRGEKLGWQWDLSYTDANNEIDLKLHDSLNVSLGSNSPLEFGVGNNENHQQIFNIELQRSFDGGLLAFPINVLAGFELSKQSYEIERGEPASFLDGGFLNQLGQPGAIGSQGFPGIRPVDEFDEGRDNIALYVNLGAEPSASLRLMFSARYDDYSDTGGQGSLKLALGYAFNRQLSLHASVGNGFRAPDIAQQYYRASQSILDTGLLLESGIYPVQSAIATTLGSTKLDFEQSLDFNFGLDFVVPEESLAEGLELSLNIYQISIDDRIVLSDELAGAGVSSLLTAAGITSVTGVRYFHNGVDTRTRGLDLSSRYTLDMATHGALLLSAVLNFNSNKVEKVHESTILSSSGANRFGRREQKQLEKGVPDSRLMLSAQWQKERMRATVKLTALGKTVVAADDAVQDRKLGAMWLLDLSVRYQATETISLVVGSNNVLDVYPDVLPVGAQSSVFDQIYPFSNYSAHGYNGRRVYASVSTSF